MMHATAVCVHNVYLTVIDFFLSYLFVIFKQYNIFTLIILIFSVPN